MRWILTLLALLLATIYNCIAYRTIGGRLTLRIAPLRCGLRADSVDITQLDGRELGLCGFGATLLGDIVTHPLGTIKTLVQSSGWSLVVHHAAKNSNL